MAGRGLRERNKQQKAERIRTAARELFRREGFAATTTRAIAERAGIGTGTLFLYASDKTALLAMVFAEEVARLEEETYASLPIAARGVTAQLRHVFERWIGHYRRDPELARVFFKELLFVGPAQRDDVATLSGAIAGRLATVIATAQRRGEIRAEVSPATAAHAVFALFYVTLLSWLSGQLSPAAARRLVREALATCYAGLGSSGRRGRR